jgi:activator of HSP90 ATPase
MNRQNSLALNADVPTRRQLIVSAAVAGGLATPANRAGARGGDEISHTAESIHQEPVFKANRRRVYEALTDATEFGKVVQLSAAMHSAMSLGNKPTEISQQVGGSFTLFGGHIVGRQIELLPNERIVQAWRVVDWNPGVYSIARFELTEQGSGTKIVFDHTGFPAGKAQHLAAGWTANYWEPLQKYLDSK